MLRPCVHVYTVNLLSSKSNSLTILYMTAFILPAFAANFDIKKCNYRRVRGQIFFFFNSNES